MEIGVLLEERDGKIKGSFRAKDENLRVDLLAKEFNGGGHACAAGFNVENTIDAFIHLWWIGLASTSNWQPRDNYDEHETRY